VLPSRSRLFQALVLCIVALRPELAAGQGTCALFATQGGIPGVGGQTNLLLLNPLTGAVNTVVGNLGMPLTGLARHPVTGELFGAQAGGNIPRNLTRVNPATGASTVIGLFGGGVRIADLTFRANGTLFGWNEGTDDLVTINTTTGASTVVGDSGLSTLGSGLAFSPNGTLFFASSTGGVTSLRTVNPATGLTTVVALLTGKPLPTEPISALAFSPSGTLFGVNLRNDVPRDSFLVSINTTTGVVTTRGAISTPRMDGLEFVCLPAFDFDRDLRANLGIFRPSTSQWFVASSRFPAPVPFGGLGDVPLPADYDGDGLADLAVFRSSTGEWFIFGSATGFQTLAFGAPAALGLGDKPIPADYDGDGKIDLAVYRSATAQWFIFGTTTGFATGVFGAPSAIGLGDTPIPADYDGDGKADLAIYRTTTGEWFVFRSTTGFQTLIFGAPSALGLGDIPVPADYDGDGKSDLAVFRSSTGEWFLFGSTTGFETHLFGAVGDTPIPTDYDGDGASDLAIYRAATGTWFIFGSATGFPGPIPFGSPAFGDIPLNRPAALR
jgi:hypothetical protein